MSDFFKVSKSDCEHFISVVQDVYPFSTLNLLRSKQNDAIITSYCLNTFTVAQCVKPDGKRAEYYINPFFKEA